MVNYLGFQNEFVKMEVYKLPTNDAICFEMKVNGQWCRAYLNAEESVSLIEFLQKQIEQINNG